MDKKEKEIFDREINKIIDNTVSDEKFFTAINIRDVDELSYISSQYLIESELSELKRNDRDMLVVLVIMDFLEDESGWEREHTILYYIKTLTLVMKERRIRELTREMSDEEECKTYYEQTLEEFEETMGTTFVDFKERMKEVDKMLDDEEEKIRLIALEHSPEKLVGAICKKNHFFLESKIKNLTQKIIKSCMIRIMSKKLVTERYGEWNNDLINDYIIELYQHLKDNFDIIL